MAVAPLPPNRLSELRVAAGLSQSALARELEVDQVTVWRWEKGRMAIRDAHKLALAQRFGVTVAWLMGWPDGASTNTDLMPSAGDAR